MLINSYSKLIECGTDEAGRGCLAGPVTAAAVILPNDFRNNSGMVGMLDSIILGVIYFTKSRAAI